MAEIRLQMLLRKDTPSLLDHWSFKGADVWLNCNLYQLSNPLSRSSFPSFFFPPSFPLLLRRGPLEKVRHPGPLPGRYQPLGDRHRGVPDAEAQPVTQRRLRLCQAEKVEHFSKLQLHGPAPGLWADAGPQQPLRQPLVLPDTRPALLHHPDQSQCVSTGHAGVHMKIKGRGRLSHPKGRGGVVTMVTSGCTEGKQPVLMNVLASGGSLSKSLATEQLWRERGGHRCHVKGNGEILNREGTLTGGFTMASSSELIEIEEKAQLVL